VEADQITAA